MIPLFCLLVFSSFAFIGQLGSFIAARRAPKVQKLYEAIGGGSPIFKVLSCLFLLLSFPLLPSFFPLAQLCVCMHACMHADLAPPLPPPP